jgi:hypothetical protein
MKIFFSKLIPTISVLAHLSLSFSIQAETDNFNDGNDTGWTRYTPVTAVSTPTYSFPQGSTYRLQATGAQNTQLGPARVGSYLPNAIYSSFYASVDLVDWNNSLDQLFGLLTRMSSPGVGTLNGYALTYATRTGRSALGQLQILRITGERGTALAGASLDISLNPQHDYRFVFVGTGPSFTGKVYELPNLTDPFATLTGSDATYGQGLAGFFTYDNSNPATNPVDVTLDNFVLLDSPPPSLEIFLDQNLFINVSWPTPFAGWSLETTTNLSAGVWTSLQSDVFESGGRFYYSADGSIGNRFFRLTHP